MLEAGLLSLSLLLAAAAPVTPDLTERHAATFADDHVAVYPARVARRWLVPFSTADRGARRTMKVISRFGANRVSYVRGHLHSGADLVPSAPGEPFVHVLPVAWGAVCSIHLGAPHTTVVVEHRMADGQRLFTSYKHLAETYVEVGQQVSPETKLGRLYTRREARVQGGPYDHLHLEVRKDFDDHGAASWTTMSEAALRARFLDPVTFLEQRLGREQPVDVFDAYLDATEPIADGFGPLGGERAVLAAASGRVLSVGEPGSPGAKVVVLQHVYYENHRRERVQSIYRHLEHVDVVAGQIVQRGQRIGGVGPGRDAQRASWSPPELRLDETLGPTKTPPDEQRVVDPVAFVAAHSQLVVPQLEERLLLIDQESYRLRLYERGVLKVEHDIALGQGSGRKRQRGDLKTPKGLYFVVARSRGPFDGPYGAYYGGHWIKVNYPNAFDAAAGLERGLISAKQAREIEAAWRARELTPQETRLGSGIGLHGWIEEWDGRDSRHLSWGCVVVHNRDIAALYDLLAPGTAVVVF